MADRSDGRAEVSGTLAVPIATVSKETPITVNARFLFGVFYVGLLFALIFGAAYLGFATWKDVRVETRMVEIAPKVSDVASASKALGTPAGTLSGQEVGAQLQGAACEVWPLPDGAALVCHAP